MKNTMNSKTMDLDLGNLEAVSGGAADASNKQPQFKQYDSVYMRGYGNTIGYIQGILYDERSGGYVYWIFSRAGVGYAEEKDLSYTPFT